MPYYIEDIARKRTRMYAIVAGKPESEWLEIDNTYEYMFSLYPNDILRVKNNNGEEIFGYYRGCHRTTGGIGIISHDSAKTEKMIGIRNAAVLEKYTVDVLGEYHKVKSEKSACGKLFRKAEKKKARTAA